MAGVGRHLDRGIFRHEDRCMMTGGLRSKDGGGEAGRRVVEGTESYFRCGKQQISFPKRIAWNPGSSGLNFQSVGIIVNPPWSPVQHIQQLDRQQRAPGSQNLGDFCL